MKKNPNIEKQFDDKIFELIELKYILIMLIILMIYSNSLFSLDFLK